MADLVAEFFSRDLSSAEAAELELIFENSADEAGRFSELALAEYQGMGLPEPKWKSRRGIFRGGTGKWWLALLMAAPAVWAFFPDPRSRRPNLGLEGEVFTVEKARARVVAIKALPAVGKPMAQEVSESEGPRVNASRKMPGTTQRGNRLGVLVKQAATGPARVTVKDRQGRELLQLFDGPLPVGERRFEWDGRLADGSAATPGSYAIEVRRGESVQTKQLTLKPARP